MMLRPSHLNGLNIELAKGAYQSLFNILALRFSSHASSKVQSAEVLEINARLAVKNSKSRESSPRSSSVPAEGSLELWDPWTDDDTITAVSSMDVSGILTKALTKMSSEDLRAITAVNTIE